MIAALIVAASLAAASQPPPVTSGREVRRLALVFAANSGGPEREVLRYAVDDARAFARVLEQMGGVSPADQTILLDPGRTEVEHAVERIGAEAKNIAAAGRRVELIVYYSGHSDEQGLMLGRERLSYAELRGALQRVPAQVRVAILDSCSSGEFTRKKGGARVAPFLMDASTQLEGHAFLTSSSADEAAQESDRIGGSFFTHYLVTGLRGAADVSGDRRVTLNEAYQFAFNETLKRTETTKSGPQHPAYEIQLSGTGELVMTDLRTTPSGLQLTRELSGRVFVRDASQRLVAELEKHAGHAVELGLEAGAYKVTLERDGKAYLVELNVPKGEVTKLSEPALVAVAREPTRARGGHADAPLVPVNVAFAPLMGINDAVGGSPRNFLSINMLGTSGGSLHGLGAGLAEMQRRELYGVTMQGIGSWVGGELVGLQASGMGNVVQGRVGGLQMAGVVNVAGADVVGMQASGAVNWARGQVRGMQVAGVGNLSGGPMIGVQAAGAVNYAQVAKGLQVSVVNVGGSVTGVQAGVVNVAEEVDGVQVGVVNIAKKMSGAPIGLVSVIGDGQMHIDVWATDTHPLNVGFRFGSKRFYTFFSEASESLRFSGPFHGYTAFGIGARMPVGPIALDVDLMSGSVHENFNSPGLRLLSKLRVGADYALAPKFHVFGGIAVNNWLSNAEEVPEFVRFPSREVGSGSVQVRLWPGAFAGIRI